MATFTVTNLLDSGLGSLRNAIFQANTASTTDTINFDTSLNGGTIGLTSGELGISDNLTINGLGTDFLSVDAGGTSRVFNVSDGNSANDLKVAIKGLTITGGYASGNTFPSDAGGGIFNQENLTITNSTVSDNQGYINGGGISSSGELTITNSTVSDNYGAGISNSGELTITNSTVSGNFNRGIDNSSGNVTVSSSTISGNTALFGGGILNSGDMTVTNSTISSNEAVFYTGGGIFNYNGNLTVTNSTISDNGADRYGGGIENDGNLTVTNSTISDNVAGRGGGGISNGTYSTDTATATITGSIIADNLFNDGDTYGNPLISGGNNLIGNGYGYSGGGFTNGVNGDIVGTTADPIDPRLGPLQDNGGPTQTQALLPGSPAINAGSNPLNLKFDQRGPGFNRVVGAQADIGAVEAVPEPHSTLGVLGAAVVGVVFYRKRQRYRKAKAMM